MSTMLEVQHLKKYFDTPAGKLHAVDDVSFTLEEGKTLGLVGESGCGKSTLGRLLIHLLESTDGKIIFMGKDVTGAKGKELKKLHENMQIIFQDPYSSLNPRRTVAQTIAEPLELRGGLTRKEIAQKTQELMATVGLAPRLTNSYPHELDGGRRQRIGIARALALDPKFIICDEPVSALDVSIQAQILNLLQDIQEERGLTYIFITHDLSVVKFISHEIVVMYLGQMVEKAPSDELFEKPWHPYTEALLSAIPIPDPHNQRKRITLEGELTSPIEPDSGCRFRTRCRYATEACGQPVALRELSPNHFVACNRVEEIRNL